MDRELTAVSEVELGSWFIFSFVVGNTRMHPGVSDYLDVEGVAYRGWTKAVPAGNTVPR